MRVAVSHILLLSLVVNTFFASGYVVEYYLKLDTYLELCENKSRPMLNCDGKCILAKKITAAQQPGTEKSDMVAPACFEYVFSFFKTNFNRDFTFDESQFGWLSLYSFELSDPFFIPPRG
ncbi:MAG: hypothetical protein GY816_20515 [Cytophagales bacterium]|nr:hypothetical protein [Cytophagales bacterium]